MKKLGLGIIGCLFALSVQANIIITGTRVIYPANQKVVNVQLTNQTDRPALMQAWIDDGDELSSPSTISATRVPFIIVPPVSRMEANAGQTLRITYTAKSELPKDRESIFYLNVLDIPPKPQKGEIETNNYLQIALRSRIKLFYRPILTMQPSEAYQAVQWQTTAGNLKINNPTPYFITFSSVKVNNQSLNNVGMIAPFSSKELKNKVKAGQKVHWAVINDFGADEAGESTVK
ncbi:fimbria/pilus periplasmic chaperone [Ursidibacter arcticus]